MDIDKIKQELREFLTRSFRIHEIKNTDNIFDTGIVHSLFFIQLLIFIEKNFNVELHDGEFDIANLTTIDSIAGLIANKFQ